MIELLDVFGSDQLVVKCARISTGKGLKLPEEDKKLIDYLIRNRHTSPFEMCELMFHVRVPMDTWRQWIRHRTANVNEYSTRYSEAIDEMAKAGEWRTQGSVKQGSAGPLVDWPEGTTIKGGWAKLPDGEEIFAGTDNIIDYLNATEVAFQKLALQLYKRRLKLGVAKEQARKDLPLSTYTEAFWKIDLHNFMHFLMLRMDSHAQKEIRDAATQCYELAKPKFPWCFESFDRHIKHKLQLERTLYDLKIRHKKGEDVDAQIIEAVCTDL